MPAHRISVTVRVLTAVITSPIPMRPCDVARALNVRSNTVRTLLGRLCDRGDIQQLGDNRYHGPNPDGPHIWDIFGVR